ncbi:hypothetical protein [Nonomuraea sp. MG754425]|uniref:hypothetical protein n=1 Tax=Nonomuraea sp. MG754425 TaxID=2570319 RepID=UPI001F460397|nr:hypothetical protein [Nonomuraea sp. MG754425]
MLSALVVQTRSVQAVRAAVEQAGGFAAQLADIEEVAAFRGDAHELLVCQFFKKDRLALFELRSVCWSRPPRLRTGPGRGGDRLRTRG